ncbi:hypothetical protein F5Y18DRAFT_420182 [Xylariaceae sp. FL1019]|nr:hypothetical protein F5Y18DRAFT_420182 [Xylariaceae sp. FL1019]
MSKELNELRIQQARGTRETSTGSSTSAHSREGSSSVTQPTEAGYNENFDFSEQTVQIGGVAVASETAVEAFKIFAARIHPQLPILGSISINDIYRSSPLLFWVIIIVVSSHTTIPTDEHLYNAIALPFQNMLRSEAMKAPLPISKIQALLFMCMWPMPIDSQPKDPSWLYCGMAVNSAIYMGLHRFGPPPTSRGLGTPAGTRLERILTWLGCFYVSGTLAMHLGVPSMINTSADLSLLTSKLSEFSIPQDFAAEVRLQAIFADFTNVLSHSANNGGAIDSSILHLLDHELENLKAQYPDQWAHKLEYNSLVGKIHIYAWVVSRDHTKRTTRDIMLKLCLSTSIRIVHLANRHFKDEEESTPDTPELARLSPVLRFRSMAKTYFKGIAFITAFLLRYFSLNTSATGEEQQLAANHVVIAHAIMKSCSLYPTDEYGRAARTFEELCQQTPIFVDTQSERTHVGMAARTLIQSMKAAILPRTATPLLASNECLIPATLPIAPTTATGPPRTMSPSAFVGGGMAQPLDLDPFSNDMGFLGQYWNNPFDAFFEQP